MKLWLTCLWAPSSQGISWETPSPRWNTVIYASQAALMFSLPLLRLQQPQWEDQQEQRRQLFWARASSLKPWRMSCFPCWGAPQSHSTLGCFSIHLHTHMGMPSAPGHESWPQRLTPPCQWEFCEDAGRSCMLLGQHGPFLLMENRMGCCSTDQSSKLLGLQATLSHFIPGMTDHLFLMSPCLRDEDSWTQILGMQHLYDLYVHFIPHTGYIYVM